MTTVEQLDEALKFLATHGHKGGSYDFYDKRRAEWNKEYDYLFKHLESIGVKEEDLYPIVYNLYYDKYIDAVWEPPEEKERGNYPNQIKINLNGKTFINNAGGYKKLNTERQRLAILEKSQRRNIPLNVVVDCFNCSKYFCCRSVSFSLEITKFFSQKNPSP